MMEYVYGICQSPRLMFNPSEFFIPPNQMAKKRVSILARVTCSDYQGKLFEHLIGHLITVVSDD